MGISLARGRGMENWAPLSVRRDELSASSNAAAKSKGLVSRGPEERSQSRAPMLQFLMTASAGLGLQAVFPGLRAAVLGREAIGFARLFADG